MDKTYQLATESKSYLISPWTTEEILDQKTCFEIDGPVKPQSVLPSNVSAFQVHVTFNESLVQPQNFTEFLN
jgi:hypothetical protein